MHLQSLVKGLVWIQIRSTYVDINAPVQQVLGGEEHVFMPLREQTPLPGLSFWPWASPVQFPEDLDKLGIIPWVHREPNLC